MAIKKRKIKDMSLDTTTVQGSATVVDIPAVDKPNKQDVKQFISEVHKIVSQSLKNEQITSKEKDFENIQNLLTEYLNSFILFGYTANNERVLMSFYKNQLEQDALVEQLRKLFFNTMENN